MSVIWVYETSNAMRILKLIIHAVCIWLFVCKSAEGSDINCKEDCACCINRECGKGIYFSDECFFGCIDGYRGARCTQKCTYNCTKCEDSANICTACYDGYYRGTAHDCTLKCLPNCKTCTSGISCTSCNEEYYNDKGYNDCRYRKCPGNCECENSQCVSCTNGFYDISNSCNNLCPGNCVKCSSSTDCESCKVGYYNGYQNDDRSFAFLNNCTNICQANCLICSFHGHCSVCKSGFYGLICEKSCSVGCASGLCDIKTGNCDCSLNFVGDKCDKCPSGIFGDICDKQCSPGCKGNVCEKDSGDCKDGCILNTIFGDKCDSCSVGWYGLNCNLSCSIGCKNSKCNRTQGICTNGCLSYNFKGNQCDQCINGKYGDLCNYYCPSNCDGDGCLKESGNCIKCTQNFVGEKCDECVTGLYGSNCSENCPSKCLNNACDRDSGTCLHGCIVNYSGDRCCVNNKNCINCLSATICMKCKPRYFNDQCDESCNKNCLDSCNIKTGICDDCKMHFYGERCNTSCSSTCKTLIARDESQCQQTDGKCVYGCDDGFYGMNCSQECSNFCNDKICKQGDGTCINGCQKKVKDDPFCPLASASKSPEQPQNTATIIPWTILAVSVVGNVILVVAVILLKFRKRVNTGERAERTLYENADMELKFGNVANVNDKTSAAQASINENMTRAQDYEDLDRVQVTEQAYGRIGTPAGD